jgi:putative DNA methylase
LTHPIKAPRKLIEVALPLDDINEQAAREKSIRHGHPSTLHLWWARRPLAAARAVIFAQLVNDPSWKWELENPGVAPPPHVKGGHANARRHLFALISELVKWENTNNEELLEKARSEIRKSWRETCEVNRDHPEAATLFDPDKLPGLHDPFAGGGTIPLEAQRLGLEAFASDLNPVAVLINKAMIEIPPKFAGRPPVHPDALRDPENFGRVWKGAQGLAEDVRRYGAWMRAEAEKRIGHLYPKVKVTAELAADRPDLQGLVGQELTVIAWLWARTVKSPNPAFSHADVPLASTFMLSTKEGKEAWVEPLVEGDRYRFVVRIGKPPEEANEGTKAPGRGANFSCVLSGAPIDGNYIKAEGQAGRLGTRLIAVVAEGLRARVYLDPSNAVERVAHSAQPAWRPEGEVPARLTGGTCVPYGLRQWGDLFTSRQLVGLTTISDLIAEARDRILHDAVLAKFAEDSIGLEQGGSGASAYADAICVLLAFALDKTVDGSSSLCRWMVQRDSLFSTFGRQALPMTWDFAEVNLLADCTRSLSESIQWTAESIEGLVPGGEVVAGFAQQASASSQHLSEHKFVSTDPPYYDNISYADLSDFFYVWLRRALRQHMPQLFASITVPKAEELVATPHRHGTKEKAEVFFLEGMTQAIGRLASQAHPGGPITIYYAFKQAETRLDGGTSSTGWETFLEAVLKAGLALSGTWPIRTERAFRSVSIDSNALASSIVLVCRRRPADAPTASRRDFQRELDAILPVALDAMTRGTEEDRSPVAPVDLSQAIIGPGMAVFSRYAAVIEADGRP